MTKHCRITHQETTARMLAAVGWANRKLDELGVGDVSCIVYHSGGAHLLGYRGNVLGAQLGEPEVACGFLVFSLTLGSPPWSRRHRRRSVEDGQHVVDPFLVGVDESCEMCVAVGGWKLLEEIPEDRSVAREGAFGVVRHGGLTEVATVEFTVKRGKERLNSEANARRDALRGLNIEAGASCEVGLRGISGFRGKASKDRECGIMEGMPGRGDDACQRRTPR